MRRARKYAITVFILLILQITLTVAITAKNVTISSEEYDAVVDKSGNGDFTNIQDAINHAKTGSTVYVRSGEYTEIIQIKKSLSLVGEDKESTLINPISEKNKYAVYVGASNIFVSGFTITNEAPGIYSQAIKISSDNAKISNCNIYDTPVGIAVWSDSNTIENCVFKGCKDEGIALLGGKSNPCNYNTISDCIFYDNCDAIELQYSSGNTISNCEIYENTHSGIDAIASNNNENTISNCNIYDNRVHGIYISSSKQNKIIDCKIENNRDGNIIMNKYSTDNEIINNQDVDSSKNFALVFKTFLEVMSNFKTQRFQNLIGNLNF